MFLWCVRDGWREIYSERGALPIFSSRSQGVPTLAPPCKFLRDNLIGCVSLTRLQFSALCLNLTVWFSSHGLLLVIHLLYPSALIMLPCLLITTWQLVKAHGVNRNEPKIHVICYITISMHIFPISNGHIYCLPTVDPVKFKRPLAQEKDSSNNLLDDCEWPYSWRLIQH